MAADLLDRIAGRGEALFLLAGRLAIALLFVPSGFEKLTHLGGFAASLASRGVPASLPLAALGAATEFFGGLAVALGVKTRYTALLLIAFVIIATLISHRFWILEGPARMNMYVHFMKNIAIIGGFCLLFARGAGPWSIDRR